jgi:hypothetical protein
MKPEQIKALQIKRPFQAFRLRLADGSSHAIQHPELVWITDSLIGIASALDHPTTGVPFKATLCAPEHVVAVEMLPRSRSKAA